MSAPFDMMLSGEGGLSSLAEAALLVRRSGLEHLVTDPTPEEIFALAAAGDRLTQERVARLVVALRNPGAALRPFDDGATEREDIRRDFLAGGAPHGG